MEVTTEPKPQIDESSQRNLSFSTPIAGDPSSDKLPFFRHRSRQIKRDTWLVSVFVLLQIVVFAVTMGVNDCSRNSDDHCAAKLLGRFSFQPLSENPMLGPSASTFEHMGGLYWNALVEKHEIWRVLTSPWLHSGLFHLLINLGSLIFVGIFMEQRYGPFRIAVIYFLSGIVGSLFAVLFVRNIPSICSGAALFGLIGAMLSALARDWNLYTSKVSALVIILTISTVNFLIGFLPYIDNFANIGGFISGFLLGFVLLFTPQLRQDPPPHKGKLFEDDMRSSTRLKEMFDRPVLRIVCLVMFCGILGGVLIAASWGINLNRYCNWCRYVDCVPTRKWSCSDLTTSCEAMVSDAQLTLTCMTNGKFRIFPYTNISQARTQDLCTLVCT
ncbi:RHOMBOID-like protein 8 [Hirschfeldia incana]|nr:RHOMBOID-like protein 8 [Hirschfeldia incana]